MIYRHAEKLQLYRSLLKGANRFPMASRREVVGGEVRAAFRNPLNSDLSNSEVDLKITLGWERERAIDVYARNMYWFHSRDEVTKEMLHHSLERDRKRADQMRRFVEVGSATNSDETPFKTAYDNVSPGYSKVMSRKLNHPSDIWRARGQHASDAGGPKQKFFVRRFKALFPQGW